MCFVRYFDLQGQKNLDNFQNKLAENLNTETEQSSRRPSSLGHAPLI